MDINTTQVMMLANKIKDTIEVSLNPMASQIERTKAYQAQEEFKSSSPYCAEVGFYLFYRGHNCDAAVRLCGLKFIEHFVKFAWNDISRNKGEVFKIEALNLIDQTNFDDPSYLKETAVKVVVEIIKRSWPQLWGDLFTDLNTLQKKGDAQLEMVLIVLMRLSEDVNGLDERLTPKRRKEMTGTLTENGNDLYEFFITTLKSKAMLLKSEFSDAKRNIRLAEATLFTIMEFSSWIKFEYLLADNKALFQILFWLLEVEELRYHAAECLDTIFQRKGMPEQRKDFMVVLSDDALDIVYNVISTLKKTEENILEEIGYKFLKKLAEALANFGRIQILPLWGDDKGFQDRPTCFDRYQQLLLQLFQHESMVIGCSAAKFWQLLAVHTKGKEDQLFIQLVPDLLDCVLSKLAKIADPDIPNNIPSMYSEMDFDDKEGYAEAFGLCRGQMIDVSRKLTEVAPLVVLDHCLLKIRQATSSTPPDMTGLSKEEILLSLHCVRWDALAHYLKHGFSNVYFKTTQHVAEEVLVKCNEMLSLLLNYKHESALLMFPQIYIIEAMFPLFKHSQEHLLPTIMMLSNLVSLPQVKVKSGDDHLFKLKRHSCIAFLNLCKEIPDHLANIFEQLRVFVSEQMMNNSSMTGHEKCLLMEGVMRTSKHLNNKQLQAEFLNSIFDLIENIFNKDAFVRACESPQGLISALELDQTGKVEEDSELRKREVNDQISDGDMKAQMEIFPWIRRMITFLPKLFDLLKQHSLLWTCQEKLFNVNVLTHKVVNEQHYVSTAPLPVDGETNERCGLGQFYLCTLYEQLYTGLSYSCRSIGSSLYTLNGLVDAINEKLVDHWTHLPNYRLARILKTYVKGFILSCPARFYHTVIGPFLSHVLKVYFQRVISEWASIKSTTQTDKRDVKDLNESSEVTEERMIYHLSKDFIDVIGNLLTYKRSNEKLNSKKLPEGSVEMFGTLGDFLLNYEGTNLTILEALYTSLTWPDTSVVSKVALLHLQLIQKVFVSKSQVDVELPKQVLLLILKGLQVHGSDEIGKTALSNMACQFYVHLRMRYHQLVDVMLMVPTCTAEVLQEFDLGVFASDNPLTELQRKRIFKNFVAGACNKKVSKLHEQHIEIKDLPSLLPRTKEKRVVLDEETDDVTGLCNLFDP